MGAIGAKRITVNMAKEMWDLHDKGKKNIAIAVACDCSEVSVNRMINIYEYAKKNPGKPIEIYPGKWSEIKKAAREKFTVPPPSVSKVDNAQTFLVAVLKQLNMINDRLNSICEALDIK